MLQRRRYMLCKDHRTSCETSDVAAVLDGELDEFIEAALMLAASGAREA